MDKSLLLRAYVEGRDALLLLNGMVLASLKDRQELRLPVHEFVQAGENRVQVLVPGGTATSCDENPLSASDCSAQVWVELQKDRGPASLVQPSVLFKLEGAIERGQRMKKSRILDACVDLPVSFPRWRYLDVMQADASAGDQALIQDFLLNLISLFRTRKIASLLPYFSIRNRELAAAYGLDLQQVHKNFVAHLEYLCSQCTLSDAVLDPSQWVFHPVRNSSVYALLNSEHQTLLQFVSAHDNRCWQWPMHVGVLGSEVFVMR